MEASESQLTDWSIRGLYQALKEPIPAEITGRLEKLDKAKSDDLQRLLHDVRAGLGFRKELDDKRDLDICLEAIMAKLEAGVAPEQRSRFNHRPLPFGYYSKPVGVGLELEIDAKTKMLRVVTPILNGPAYKAGIRAGDIVSEIRIETDEDGKPSKVQTFPTKGMTVERAMELLRGKPGTSVKVTVIPAK